MRYTEKELHLSSKLSLNNSQFCTLAIMCTVCDNDVENQTAAVRNVSFVVSQLVCISCHAVYSSVSAKNGMFTYCTKKAKKGF